jgi:hypothetical protein
MSQCNERFTQADADRLAHWLIRCAARRAPHCLSSRLEEEWLADLESRASGLARLRFAMSCCWAAGVIGRDYQRGHLTPASPVVASGTAIALVDRNLNYFSLGSPTLFLIVGLHAALFCGLITTLSLARAGSEASDDAAVALITLTREAQ